MQKMKTNNEIMLPEELNKLIDSVRDLINDKKYDACFDEIRQTMDDFPHAPHPHNLLGILLEKTGDHSGAMKHFRAALALDPAYLPASHNLNTYGSFFSSGFSAYDESDLPPEREGNVEIIYDSRGIGHLVRKTQIQYDSYGIGHLVRR